MTQINFWKDKKTREEVIKLIQRYPFPTFTYDEFYEFAKRNGWNKSINTLERVLRALGQEGKVIARKYLGKKTVFVKNTSKEYEELQRLRKEYYEARTKGRYDKVREIIDYIEKKFKTTRAKALEILIGGEMHG